MRARLQCIPVWLLVCVAACLPGKAHGQEVVAKVFAPETISTGNVFRGSFTPDGREFYFFKNVIEGEEEYRIFRSQLVDGRWTEPEQVNLSGDFSDLYPAIAPDGRRMVFSSYRPAPGDTSAHASAYLWYAEREGAGWGEPVFMAEASRFAHYHSQPTFDDRGDLHFIRSTWDYRRDGEFTAQWDGMRYAEPDTSAAWQYWRDRLPGDAFLWETAPGHDGSYVLMVVSERDPETNRPGPPDLHVAFRSGEGWTEARPLGAGVNTSGTENFAFYSPDRQTLYFVRDFNAFYHVPLRDALGDGSR